VNVMGVAVPKATGLPSLSVTVGACPCGAAEAPVKVRVLSPAYPVAVLLPESRAVIVRSCDPPRWSL